MKFGALILILGILLIGAGIYLLVSQPASGPSTAIPNTTNNTSPPTGTPKTYNINIMGYTFSPSNLAIKSGDTVIWTNLDPMAHTITSDSGTELNSSSLSNGQSYSHTFSTVGTFAYHCSVHANMKGTITITA